MLRDLLLFVFQLVFLKMNVFYSRDALIFYVQENVNLTKELQALGDWVRVVGFVFVL